MVMESISRALLRGTESNFEVERLSLSLIWAGGMFREIEELVEWGNKEWLIII